MKLTKEMAIRKAIRHWSEAAKTGWRPGDTRAGLQLGCWLCEYVASKDTDNFGSGRVLDCRKYCPVYLLTDFPFDFACEHDRESGLYKWRTVLSLDARKRAARKIVDQLQTMLVKMHKRQEPWS
jgi:hypothetical protein